MARTPRVEELARILAESLGEAESFWGEKTHRVTQRFGSHNPAPEALGGRAGFVVLDETSGVSYRVTVERTA